MTSPRRLARIMPVLLPRAAAGGLIAATLLLGGCGILFPYESGPQPTSTPSPTPTPDDDTAALLREIEEADIVRLDGDYLYLANAYRGLQIIDVGTPDAPVRVGSLALGGRGVELLVNGDEVYLLTSADFVLCGGEAVGFDAAEFTGVVSPDYTGSRLWIINVADKSNPVLNDVNVQFPGFVLATRMADEVVYAAGNYGTDVTTIWLEQRCFVNSINLTDVSNITTNSLDLPRQVRDVYASPTALYLIGDDPDLTGTTLISCVDISATDGALALRDEFRVPGLVGDRFFVDEYAGQFRIITEEYVAAAYHTVVALYVYDITDPDDITRTARLAIATDEALADVHFDGARAYALTWSADLPMYVLDLADPAAPVVAGEVDAPGLGTNLIALDNARLLGLGFSMSGGVRPTAILYDVSSLGLPRTLDEVVIGEEGDYAISSESLVDERAAQVVATAGYDGLALLPYSRFDEDEGRYRDALQILSLSSEGIAVRGSVEHRGLVRRAGLLGARLWTLSDLSFQVVNIDDLDEPVPAAEVELMTDQELLDAGLTDCADSARYRGTLAYSWYWDDYGYGCGAFNPALLIAAGLALHWVHRARRR